MTAVERRTAFRRTRRTAVGIGCAVLVSFFLTEPGAAAPDAPAAAGFNNGTGSAIALGYKANPTNGNLSFGITAGESVAGHQNTAATGQAAAIDMGVIGVTLAGEGCDGGDPTLAAEDQPQPLIARSGEKGADQGYKETEKSAPIEKFAKATTAPYAEAHTIIAPSGDEKSAYLSGGRTFTSSGVVGGNTREAVARTDIDLLSLGGGQVKLRGMTWEAIHRSGAVNQTIGTFSIDGIEIGGQKIPVQKDAIDQLAGLNAVLQPLGFKIQPPKVRVEQGIVFVDPMSIAVIPSPTRDGVTGPVIGGAQPLRDQITAALLKQDCGNASYITIADIVLGGVSGAGQVGLELGGVQATTAEINGFQFQLPPTLPPLAAVPALPTAGGVSTPAAVPAAAAPAASSGTAAQQPSTTPVATASASALSGERGGLMALIAAGGLLTLLATAEGDRRKMRNAQRAIPLEA
ncbi:MAG: hypothetical protein ACJ739_04955 [Acidimicrobiales bacterium]